MTKPTIAVILLLAGALTAFGQTTGGSISGDLVDSQQAAPVRPRNLSPLPDVFVIKTHGNSKSNPFQAGC